MPLYDYSCALCGFIEIDRKEHPDNVTVPCPKCAGTMKRLLPERIYVNMGAAGVHGYYDPNLQKYINTNHQRREEMLKQGVTEKGATPKQGVAWV